MKPLEFELVLQDRIGKIKTVLGQKAGEYARGIDRLHNFKRVARIKNCTVPDACMDGFCKHLVSILDMVDDFREGKVHNMALWEEKIGDAINYLILLEAILKEKEGANGNESNAG
jgi:hypothetical protein